MSSFTLKLEGLDQVKKEMVILTKKAEQDVIDELNNFGEGTVEDAVRNLSRPYPQGATDNGKLKNSISYIPATSGNYSVEVVVNATYAAFVEFGTRKFAASYVASLPTDWQQFAATFKGSGGGTFTEFIKRLVEWVKRKGFAADVTKGGNKSNSKSSLHKQEQAAYAIALHILLVGSRPHPFLYPAVLKNRQLLIERLNKLFP